MALPRRRFFNPLTELCAAALLVVVVLTVDRWQFSLAVLLGAVLPAILVSGKPKQIGLTLLVLAGPMLASMLLLHGLFFPEGDTVLAQWGIFRVTTEGLSFGLEMALRITVFIASLLTVALTLSIPDLLATMTHRGWDRKLVFIIGAALGLVPQVAERARQITRAQQARGLVVRRGLRSRGRALLMVSTPLMIGLLTDAAERARMLEARGFSAGAARTSYLPDTDSPRQRGARWSMLAGVGLFSVLWFAGALS